MRTKTTMLAAFLALAALAVAQKPKSRAEAEALMAIQSEQNAAAKIAKVDVFITKFADTEFKEWAYTQAAGAAEASNDGAKVIIYSDLALGVNPKAYSPMLMEAAELARSTRENDLDKDEKLAKADKLVHEAMDVIPTAPKPNAQLPDAQWEEVKKEFLGDAHRDLGMIATVRKKYDVAIAEYKQATELPAQPDPVAFIRLAGAYDDNKQPDEAIAVLAKVTDPRYKPYVDREEKRAESLKAAKK